MTGIPGAVWTVILTGAACGAIGAFTADLATDAGKLERATPDSSGWKLGFIGKMIVGAVAAVVVLTLNPPGDSWLALIGTALVAGIGGDAIVLGFVATGRVDAAEKRSADLQAAAVNQLDSIAHTVQASAAAAAGTAQASAGQEALARTVEAQIRTAKATLQAFLTR
jgi:hypothetical protein